MTIQIRWDGKHWAFDIVAKNNKVIASSGTYTRRRNALETARKVAGKLKIVCAA